MKQQIILFFSQLFGAPEIDDDVSPDMNDPELEKNGMPNGTANGGTNGHSSSAASSISNLAKLSIRTWADAIDYDAEKLFDKLFATDIHTLLSMDSLWTTRHKPRPMRFADCPDEGGSSTETGGGGNTAHSINEQRVWTLVECRDTFVYCIRALFARMKGDAVLVWDKDDDVAMDFVTAIANLRAAVFAIPLRSRFDIKCALSLL